MKTVVQIINEVVYGGNLGFAEMMDFYQKATPAQLKQMEKIAKADDKKGFKKLIKAVLKVSLDKIDGE